MNARAKLFVQEYLKDLNATQAAIRAGYSEKTARVIGAENLTKPAIAEAIRTAMNERSDRCQVTADMVVSELKKIAFSGMKDLATWNASGLEMKASSEISPDALASVQSVEEHTNQHGGSLKIRQFDKLKALELLGRHLGMFNDGLKLSGDGIRIVVEDYSKK